MSDTLVVEEKPIETVTPPNPFSEDNWKTTPTIHAEPVAVDDPVIKEKDEIIKEEKPTSDKPNEPAKIPAATPAPVQDRPENPDPATKEDKPLKFANEESEKVFNLLKEGKVDDVVSVYNEQKKLATADKLPAADRIKLAIQYQNKDFTPEDVNDFFSEQYEYPEKPVKGEFEDDADFKPKEEKYNAAVERINRRIERDAKIATTDLQKLAKEIVLPNIQNTPQADFEPTQEELAAQKKLVDEFLKSVDEGLKSFNGYESTFKDEEVELKVGYKLTKEDKAAMQPLLELSAVDAPAFLKSIKWLDDNGNINVPKLLEDLPYILDKQKILNKVVTETGNQRYAAASKSIKNIDYSGGKNGGGDIGESQQQLQDKMVHHFFNR